MVRKRLLQLLVVLLVVEFLPAFLDYRNECPGTSWQLYRCTEEDSDNICHDFTDSHMLFFTGWKYACTSKVMVFKKEKSESLCMDKGISSISWPTSMWEVQGSLTKVVYFRKVVIDYRDFVDYQLLPKPVP